MIIILLTAALLRLALMIASPLWYDEAFTSLLAHLDLTALLQATAADVHPPLWYLLEWCMVRLLPAAPIEVSTRLLSVACSVASILLTRRITGRLQFSQRAQLIAVLLVAYLPVEIYYGQEARMYQLFELLVLGMLLAVLYRRYAWFGILAALTLYTHNYGVLYVAAIAVLGMWRELRADRPVYRAGIDGMLPAPMGRLIGAAALAGVAYLPWCVYATIPQLQYMSSGSHWVQQLTIGNQIYAFVQIVIGPYYPDPLLIGMTLAVLAGTMLCLLRGWREQIELTGLVVLPWLAAVVISMVVPITHNRSLYPSVAALAMLAAYVLDNVPRPRWAWLGYGLVAVVVIGGWIGLAYAGIRRTIHMDPQGYATGLPPGSFVVHNADGSLVNYLAYNATGATHVLLDVGCPEQIGALGPRVRSAMGIQTITMDQLPASYYLAVEVGVLSSQCQVVWYHRLVDGATPIRTAEMRNDHGLVGVWQR